MVDADKIYAVIVKSLKKHCETPSIRLIDIKAVAQSMLLDVSMLVLEEVQRVVEELTKNYTVISIPYKHIMLKGPECLGDHPNQIGDMVCDVCSSRVLCMTVSEWRRIQDATSSEQTTTQDGKGGDLQGQEGEILDPVRGRP
jgi:hypothetical protein